MRCDIVADQYFTSSLKEGTRSKRGSSGTKFNFIGYTKFPPHFETFLSNSDHKSGLYQFLAQTFILLTAEKTQGLFRFVHHSKNNETCEYNIIESSCLVMTSHCHCHFVIRLVVVTRPQAFFRREKFRFGMPGLAAKMMS